MHFLNGITILLVYQLVGEVTVRLFGLTIPGPVLGMILLFITLVIRGGAGKALDSATGALLGHLSLLFVPAGVGMMVYFSRIMNEWLPIAMALIFSTVITMIVTASSMLGVQRLMAKRSRDNG